jgi:hypothetical protein
VADVQTCSTCGGSACDEGCGQCEHANAGPDSHRVCVTCRGAGVVDVPEHRVKGAPPELTPEAQAAYARTERARNLLAVVHNVCTAAGVPVEDEQGEPFSAAERVERLQRLGVHTVGM